MNPLISIIIPVYNVEKYIEKCVDSLTAQTYKNIEIILIDDGSTDSSGAICDKYAAEDSRVKVFHKENGGVSSARNLGLDNARGEWVTFVDSDDWVNDSYIQNLYSSVCDEVDLVVSSAILVNHSSPYKYSYRKTKISQNNFEELFNSFDLDKRTSPWGKLYATQVIKDNNLRFIQGMHIGEDAQFLYRYLVSCRDVIISNHMDYFYCYDTEGSLTKKINPVESEQVALIEMNKAIDLLIEKRLITGELALKKLQRLKGYYIHRCITSVYHYRPPYKERIKRLKLVNIMTYKVFVDEYNSMFLRFQLFLLHHRFFLLYDFCRIMIKCFKVCVSH